jgi:HK97 family phage major capsid protein
MQPTLDDLTERFQQSRDARMFVKALRAIATGARPEFQAKSTVAAMTSTTMSDLMSHSRPFVSVLARKTVLGQLKGTVNAPPLLPLPTIVQEPEPQWVGELQPIAAARFDLGQELTYAHNIAIIVAITKEIVRSTDDRALSVLEALVVRALRLAEDRALLSSDAAVLQERPAGLLFGLSPISTGSPGALDSALSELWGAVRSGDAQAPTFVLSPRAGAYLASLRTTDGNFSFPGVGPLGGTLLGAPVVTSRAAGEHVVLLDGSMLAVVDEGLDATQSSHAAIALDDNPSSPAQFVSSFQTNSVFLKLVRWVSWQLMADDAVAYFDLPIAGSPS